MKNIVKAVRIILKILILVLTAVWGVIFGILAPLLIKSYDVTEFPLATHSVFNLWIVMGVIGYLIPCVLVMLKLYKISTVFSITGTVMTLIIHSTLMALKNGEYEASPSFLYLPQIFMTLFVIIITVCENFNIIVYANSKRKLKHDAPAPSVLNGKIEDSNKQRR